MAGRHQHGHSLTKAPTYAQQNGAEQAQTNGNPEQAKQAGTAKSGASKLGGSRAEERIAALDTEGASVGAQIEELTQQLEMAEQRAAEAEAGWQRARADYQNLKRRSLADIESALLHGQRPLLDCRRQGLRRERAARPPASEN